MTERSVSRVGRWPGLSEWDAFEDLFGRPLRSGLLRDVFGDRVSQVRAFSPAVDVTEDDDQYVISTELPGAKRDEVTVEVHDGVLTIRGEKRSEREEKNEHARYLERSYGSFSRSFTLPSNANGEKLEASFRDGVLTVQVPKREEAKPRTIAIRS